MAQIMHFKDDERTFLLEMIRVYRSLPALWKVKSKEYTDRQKKSQAYEVLVERFKLKYPDANRELVKRKMNIIRTNYRKELKKIASSRKLGSGRLYKPTLYYFEELRFLHNEDEIENGKHERNLRIETVPVDDYPSADSPLSPRVLLQRENSENHLRSCKRTKENHLKSQDHLLLDCEDVHREDSEYDALAKTWIADLQKMDPIQMLYARKSINEILIEGRLGNLHKDSVQINLDKTPPFEMSTRSSQNSINVLMEDGYMKYELD